MIANREIFIPKHIDIYHLTREMDPSEKSALECVMEVDQVRLQLEKEAEDLALSTSDGKAIFIYLYQLALSTSDGKEIFIYLSIGALHV